MRRTEDSKAEPWGFIALSWHASYWKQEIPGRIWGRSNTSVKDGGKHRSRLGGFFFPQRDADSSTSK